MPISQQKKWYDSKQNIKLELEDKKKWNNGKDLFSITESNQMLIEPQIKI
jgi:hypothetical protein